MLVMIEIVRKLYFFSRSFCISNLYTFFAFIFFTLSVHSKEMHDRIKDLQFAHKDAMLTL